MPLPAPLTVNRWTRPLPESVTTRVPSGAKATPCGNSSWPGAVPRVPHLVTKSPSAVNTSISWLSRLATKTRSVPGWTATSQAKLIEPGSATVPRKPNANGSEPSAPTGGCAGSTSR